MFLGPDDGDRVFTMAIFHVWSYSEYNHPMITLSVVSVSEILYSHMLNFLYFSHVYFSHVLVGNIYCSVFLFNLNNFACEIMDFLMCIFKMV